MASNKLRVAILGASGYTGAELVRLLSRHPQVAIVALTADRQAGKPAAEVFPHLQVRDLPTLSKIDDIRWDGVDFVFCCLPHGLTQEVIAKLPLHLRIVDLSADIVGSALCDHERLATLPYASGMRYFRSELDDHILRSSCPAGVCRPIAVAADAAH